MYRQELPEPSSQEIGKYKKPEEKPRSTNVFSRISQYMSSGEKTRAKSSREKIRQKSSREIAGPSAELSGFGASPENDYGDRVWKISSRYNVNTFETFEALREHVHKIKEELLSERCKVNRALNSEEYMIGAYLEEIEPQVAGAVFDMSRKGYVTTDSGFDTNDHSIQSIIGYFYLDKDTKRNLNGIGVEVKEYTRNIDGFSGTEILFKANEPNLKTIRDQWRAVTKLIPKIGDMEENLNSIAAFARVRAENDPIKMKKYIREQVANNGVFL